MLSAYVGHHIQYTKMHGLNNKEMEIVCDSKSWQFRMLKPSSLRIFGYEKNYSQMHIVWYLLNHSSAAAICSSCLINCMEYNNITCPYQEFLLKYTVTQKSLAAKGMWNIEWHGIFAPPCSCYTLNNENRNSRFIGNNRCFKPYITDF